MPILKNNKVVPADVRPNTAIIISSSGNELGEKGSYRPWSEGPIEQFGLGDILPQPTELLDKEKRQIQTDVLLDLFELLEGSKWLFNDGWSDALAQRRTVGSENIEPGTFRGIEMDETMTYVVSLELPRNDIFGILPTAFYTNLGHLTTLVLNSNHIKGILPGPLGLLVNLENLDLSNNMLSGGLPDAMTKLSHLKNVRLQDNKLTGVLPVLHGSRNCIEVLNLCNNRIKGCFEAFATMPPPPPPPRARDGRLISLTQAEKNTRALLEREVKAAGPWPKLRELLLGQNRLTGGVQFLEMPFPSLIHFSAPNNKLNGQIPNITSSPTLEWLFLDHNRLTGPLPSSLFDLTTLRNLSLTGNALTGLVPVTVSQLTNISDLWLSHNSLTGELPVLRGLNKLKGTLKVLGVTGNAFDPDPAIAVNSLELEHHDLPEATTAEELDEMLQELAIGGFEGPSKSGLKNITVLGRDRTGPTGGEQAVKIAQGDKNWRDIQKLMGKLEEEKKVQSESLAADLEAKKWAAAEREKVDSARRAQVAKENERKERKKREIRDANTSGPRIAQQLVNAQAARKQREVELARRRRDEFG